MYDCTAYPAYGGKKIATQRWGKREIKQRGEKNEDDLFRLPPHPRPLR